MKIEKLNESHLFFNEGLLTEKEVDDALKKALKVLDKDMVKFGENFPTPATKNNQYDVMKNVEWTNGFWTGMLWLAFEVTEDDKYKVLAEKNIDTFLNRIQKNIEVDHHDLGFLYSISCVSAYKVTGNMKAKEAALLAADKLASRYQEKGEFIQAWGTLGAADNYRLIVDCLLNIPLLYWASEELNDPKYAEMADRHYTTTVKYAFREDASTFHTFYFNPENGEPIKGVTRQGYSDDSSWARGQAWAVYGTALQYKQNKNKEIFQTFEAVTNYFINRLPEDKIPYWDLIFDDNSQQSKDSSSAAIAICGMQEMMKYLPETSELKLVYKYVMHTMLKKLINDYAADGSDQSDALLKHGVYSWHSGKGVDEGNLWGDYFYMEALVRFKKDWELYW